MPQLDELDMFDPRNAAIVSNISHSAQINSGNTSRDYFRLYGDKYALVYEEEGGQQGGLGYNDFMHLAPSGRMKLLQLREYKPYLFTAPIPLSEKEIKESEVYR